MTGLSSGESSLGECRSLLEKLYKGHKLYQKLSNIKLTWVVRGMMDVFYVHRFKLVGIYKHKLSRVVSLVILYWGLNCTIRCKNKCNFSLNLVTAELRSA